MHWVCPLNLPMLVNITIQIVHHKLYYKWGVCYNNGRFVKTTYHYERTSLGSVTMGNYIINGGFAITMGGGGLS